MTIKKNDSIFPTRLIYSQRVVPREENASATFLTQLCIRVGARRKRVLSPNVLQTTTAYVESSTHPPLTVASWRKEQGWGSVELSETDWFPVHYCQDDDLCPQCTHMCMASARVHAHGVCPPSPPPHAQVRALLYWMYLFLSSFSSPASFAVHSGIIIIALLARFCSSPEWSRCRQLGKIPCYYTAEQMRMSKKALQSNKKTEERDKKNKAFGDQQTRSD